MARPRRDTANIILNVITLPFNYGIEKSIKAFRNLEFADKYKATSGWANPRSMARNITVIGLSGFGGMISMVSGMAAGAAFGAVIPVFGTIVGALVTGVACGLLGASLGAVIAKQGFRLGSYFASLFMNKTDYSVSSPEKYRVKPFKPYQTLREQGLIVRAAGYILDEQPNNVKAQALLTDIGEEKKRLKAEAGGTFCTLFGGSSLLFTDKQKDRNQKLNEAVKLLHMDPNSSENIVRAEGLKTLGMRAGR